MPIAGISLGTGLGGGTTATISGAPAAAGAAAFNIDVRDTEANIVVRTSDATGVIAFGTDTYDIYVFNGFNWQIYNNT